MNNKVFPVAQYKDYYNGEFGSLDQLAAEYARAGRYNVPKYNAEDFVATPMETTANIASYAGSLASVGSMIDPLYGTLGGAIIGGAYGAIKTAEDNNEIRDRIRTINTANRLSYQNTQNRLGYSADVLQDNLFRQSEAHAVANGGKIERKQMTIKDFENMVMKNKLSANTERCGGQIVRTYCKGGVKISFK